jgi:hypothetical protein
MTDIGIINNNQKITIKKKSTNHSMNEKTNKELDSMNRISIDIIEKFMKPPIAFIHKTSFAIDKI